MSKLGLIWEDGEDRKVLAAPSLRLVFSRAADRWTHTLELMGTGGSDAIAVARSLETDADRSGPAMIVSPVYQEIQPHNLGGPGAPLCVLLTGRLFDHHFSAAVTFVDDIHDPWSVLIDWDVADRCRAPVSHLAATYQLPLGPGDLTDATEHLALWTGENVGGGILAFHSGPPENVAIAEAGRNGTRIQAVAKGAAGVFTHRLRYRWRWSTDMDLAIRP